MDIQAPPGTEDILPEQAALWQSVEGTARAVFARYGYGEIRTPCFESTRLFVRSIGEATDIVEKEMYTFGDAADSLTLRPEATAPVVRAYLQHNLHKTKAFQKLYYIGPMFRHERPQAGRKRQFHQIGVEAIVDAALRGELDETRARHLYALGPEAVALALLATSKRIAEQGTRIAELQGESQGQQPSPSTPSGMVPVYTKSNTPKRRKKPGA